MSINFTQTLALIDRNCKSNTSSYPLADKTADINLALDRAWSLIFRANGKWQWDDSSHTDYPIITTDLVSGQRDYAFTTDGSGNLILDIYKVVVARTDGSYQEMYPVDQQSDKGTGSYWDGRNVEGNPITYDKTANGIFLDPIPDYNITDGVKIFINREGSYFTVSDTTKKAGFAGIFHEYLALLPSYMYAVRNGLKNATALEKQIEKMESAIQKHYRDRSRDESPIISGETINSK